MRDMALRSLAMLSAAVPVVFEDLAIEHLATGDLEAIPPNG